MQIKANRAGLRRPAFWTSFSLDELVAQQEVAPIADLGALDSIWSEGDLFDDALAELLEARARCRRGVRAKRSAE